MHKITHIIYVDPNLFKLLLNNFWLKKKHFDYFFLVWLVVNIELFCLCNNYCTVVPRFIEKNIYIFKHYLKLLCLQLKVKPTHWLTDYQCFSKLWSNLDIYLFYLKKVHYWSGPIVTKSKSHEEVPCKARKYSNFDNLVMYVHLIQCQYFRTINNCKLSPKWEIKVLKIWGAYRK